MYAIVDIAGQQFKVEKDQKIFVHRLDGKEGENIEFDKVLLIDNNDKVEVGEPVVKGAFIKGKILEHLKGEKVNVFRKKRRKGYKVLKGHRDHLSHVLIEEIKEKGATKSAAKKETTKAAPTKKTAPKTASTKKPVAKSSTAKTKSAASKTAKASTATKKPAVKKAKPTKKTTSSKKTKK